jgi:hypothetical protein
MEKAVCRFAHSIREALKKEGFEGAAKASEEALHELAAYPSYLCMARHVLESILRAATLAPEHAHKAKQLGLASTEDLSKDFIKLQLFGLSASTQLDEESAPLQERGLAIVCQDVPKISPR